MTPEELDPAKLLRKIIAGLCRRPVNEKVPLWSVVGELTSHGSGNSYEIVKSTGIDPNQLVERPQWLGEHQCVTNCCAECGCWLDSCDQICERCDDPQVEDEGAVGCDRCGGTGRVPDDGTNMGECDECNGEGVLA